MKKVMTKHKDLLFIAGISFFIMAFCTTSSFLYHANIDTDTNAYITMGRGLFQGKILYVDLFDHKGPLLYFLYGLSTLLFSGSYIGSYILESLFFNCSEIFKKGILLFIDVSFYCSRCKF